jgi:hypothetical protein
MLICKDIQDSANYVPLLHGNLIVSEIGLTWMMTSRISGKGACTKFKSTEKADMFRDTRDSEF